MKIKIKREGGFMGITSKVDLEYDQLTPTEQNTLNTLAEQLVQSSKKTKEIVVSPQFGSVNVEAKPVEQKLADRHLVDYDAPHVVQPHSLERIEPHINSSLESSVNKPPSSYNDSVESPMNDTGLELAGMSPSPVVPPVNDTGLELAGMPPPRSSHNPMMRDGFSYSISMKKDGKTVSMKFDDGNAPPEVLDIFQKYVQY
jgi:hypothetical protein